MEYTTYTAKTDINQLINHQTVWLMPLPVDSLGDKIYKFSHVKDHADRRGGCHENSEDGFLSGTWDETVHQVRARPLVTLHQPRHLETIVHHIQGIPGDTDIVASKQNSHVKLTERGSADLTWILLQTAAWTRGCRRTSTRGHQLSGAFAFSESPTPHPGPSCWGSQLCRNSVKQDGMEYDTFPLNLSTQRAFSYKSHLPKCLLCFYHAHADECIRASGFSISPGDIIKRNIFSLITTTLTTLP